MLAAAPLSCTIACLHAKSSFVNHSPSCLTPTVFYPSCRSDPHRSRYPVLLTRRLAIFSGLHITHCSFWDISSLLAKPYHSACESPKVQMMFTLLLDKSSSSVQAKSNNTPMLFKVELSPNVECPN